MVEVIPDSSKTHWVNRAPIGIRPYLQLSRLDRPVGYWLLALPGWIGLSFASLSHGLAWMDLVWAALILIGAIAMRGAGCTYNDIVDQDLDAQVERTALRPLPAGTVTTRQAWKWTFAQIAVGFLVWLCLPLLAKGIALLALPLVAAYPFMKRITWFPQVWLGMTFNWAVLVAYAAKTGTVSPPLFILYLGLIFWTVGYDTIYACQDMEDDAMVGIKSTALRFGGRVKLGVGVCYFISTLLIANSGFIELLSHNGPPSVQFRPWDFLATLPILFLFIGHLFWQVSTLKPTESSNSLKRFKSNFWAGFALIITLLIVSIYFD
ncbi:MAG: 4-hydroxybenzoate octaprenyltransferase [Litorimonas sp.]